MKRKFIIPVCMLITSSLLFLNGCGSAKSSNSAIASVSTSTSASSGNNGPSGPGGQPGGAGNTAAVTGTATYTQSGNSATKTNQTITAAKANESAVKITNKGSYTLTDSKISTTGNSSSMDSSSFYGLNAAVLAESGSKTTISNTTITTSGSGANGVFATGTGSTADLTDVKINCTATGAHGVDATLGGVLNLKNVDISTAGNGASAAIATDRGGGTINAAGGTVTTTGTKSPGIYSTGNITVSDAAIKTAASEAVVIEGKNSAAVMNCTISSAKNWGVFIYQSFSGDAETGTGNFTMNGGSITANEGPMFYSTNTDAIINLKGAVINAASGTLLKAGADQWGTKGSNGATVTLNADSENLAGNIVLDNISSAKLNFKNCTILKGAINTGNTAKSITVDLDKTSTWQVTGTSYLSSLTDDDTSLANIVSNGNTIYYDSSASANSWLGGKTISLAGGGKLCPVTSMK
ncbi:hypothetical protein Desaci_3416 [Desulfosporosinus acidiphilus SJ4]|uniref:Uncharacterized protein n=1 Tax=Desulfosporosinus acidiphilus (strain DSM 22704 / JCM 16185 / SJ4) TaxID=646529 RepID=I4D935_DESAJ|nr:hypothetical protein [Desulfosporosinus acidiphilus]AFM42309.1 hypothetical protein Desaci_3416 [Desulfosporosinus acidiphilus SJ4]